MLSIVHEGILSNCHSIKPVILAKERFVVKFPSILPKIWEYLVKIVEVDNFNDDRWRECAPGIHFFMDRDGAVEYFL